ncbi:hypothetical protein D3C81_2108060 [compost metagenome]
MGIGKGVVGLAFAGNRAVDHDLAAATAEGGSRATAEQVAGFRADIDKRQWRQAWSR